jgi:hypothetical protein
VLGNPGLGHRELTIPSARAADYPSWDKDGQALLIFTATPGSDSHDKLQLLSVIGAQKLRSPS